VMERVTLIPLRKRAAPGLKARRMRAGAKFTPELLR